MISRAGSSTLAIAAASLLAGVTVCPALVHAQSVAMPAMPSMPGMGAMGAQPPAAAPPQTRPPQQAPAHDDHAMAGMEMPAPSPDPAAASEPMHGMQAGAMAGMDMAHGPHMIGALGAYAMSRDASGTAWQPDSTPMHGLHGRSGDWTTMLHGDATLVYDDQGGPRGDRKTFVESMLMGMAQRPLDGGVLTLRAMGSLDPLMGKSGYPLLLQTGETANGRTHLIDRQHPHDAIMELAGAYSHPVGEAASAFLYLGLPGEPALGPATYMHRFSGMVNPEAPITHHWFDSTHVTFGVATAGLVSGPWKLEASSFTGREPDQHRWDIERPRFDSWSARVSFNPSPNWSLQLSHGFLKSPEALEPEVNQRRTTASATYNRPLVDGNWQTTFGWSRNDNRPGRKLDAWLLDSAWSKGVHTVFGRAETVSKDELFEESQPLHGQAFQVSKLSLGYAYTVPLQTHLALDLGGLVSRYSLPSALKPSYGSDPTSAMLFTRLRIR